MGQIDHAPANILNSLDSATGLSWSIPPAQPSFLKCGYHASCPMLNAPLVVRLLQQAAIAATGRPRTILFKPCGKGDSVIDIPREVAERKEFISALHSPHC